MNILKKVHWFLCDNSAIYECYHDFSYGRDGNKFKWMPFQVVREAYYEWYQFMFDGNESSQWWFWITLNDYREHDEMGYFRCYPNSFTLKAND
jgi:hypothetical protein